MFHRILIANRGEIALRVIRACREMGIESVAVYSTADQNSLHAQYATQAVCIGPPAAADSYLNMQNILTAALNTGCEAVHPGFGFLSENSEFARMCTACGLEFIGPSGDVMDRLGNKAAARQLMMQHHVPVVPGSDGPVHSDQEALEVAARIGYPVLVKASAGGGGRGIRTAESPLDLPSALSAARAEALSCFGDSEVYIEKLVRAPRHIEFQILADKHGGAVHLGERDCSMQRRRQKLLEESPGHGITPALRRQMGEAAVRAAQAAGYTGAGTIEYIMDSQGSYYFIEMNTRIQVEHPVTEELTGVDLVRQQIRIAAGLPLGFGQQDVRFDGHVIECRINAEDPVRGFAPCPGRVDFLHFPGGCGVRVDSALYNGYTTSPFYDSMVAKVIVRGATRLEAIRRMRRALEEMVIEGISTTQELEHLILYHGDFIRGKYDTSFIEKHLDELVAMLGSREG